MLEIFRSESIESLVECPCHVHPFTDFKNFISDAYLGSFDGVNDPSLWIIQKCCHYIVEVWFLSALCFISDFCLKTHKYVEICAVYYPDLYFYKIKYDNPSSNSLRQNNCLDIQNSFSSNGFLLFKWNSFSFIYWNLHVIKTFFNYF